jgi:hypothetical protein
LTCAFWELAMGRALLALMCFFLLSPTLFGQDKQDCFTGIRAFTASGFYGCPTRSHALR